MPRVTFALCVVVLTGIAATAHSQPAQPRRIVGTQTSGHFEMKGATQTRVDYATLTFSDDTGAPAFTIDFVVQYQGPRPASTPGVVDIVITQLPAHDEHPEMTMQIDGRALPLVPRLRSRRSVVASIPFDDFVMLTNANAIVERAFDTELEFGAGQRRMLQSVARRWSGQ